ncbi:hypothetical protein [Trinickia dabaoshanensis]|uniref:hypothetical protein n=1 Tax=Trinickia dabaoshanensis TaxID=564714 RepID=UPI000C880D76|nr:hypothetical protein [Trinickia dabaoshanensis]
MPLRFLIVSVAALPFSIALCAAFAMLLPGGWRHSAIGAMVLSIPVWVGAASWWVGVASHRRLAAYLAGGNLVAFALLYAAQRIGSAS